MYVLQIANEGINGITHPLTQGHKKSTVSKATIAMGQQIT
jgi:hypothetical protein